MTERPESPLAEHPLRRSASRLLAASFAASILFGTLASIDAYWADAQTPERHLSAVVGETIELSGKLGLRRSEALPTLSVRIRPETDRISVRGTHVSSHPLSSDIRWRTTLTLFPDLPSGRYGLVVAPSGYGTGALGAPETSWALDVFPSVSALEAASPSRFVRILGTEPLDAAIGALLAALLFSLAWLLLQSVRFLRIDRHGFLRVYHTKEAGDDTLLYCLDLEERLRSDRSYPILSANGRTIGSARLASRERRFCVLRLAAAQARAGCVVLLTANR